MNKRTKTRQKKHDESVLRSAEWYKKHGFITKADLPGWNKPKKIGGFIPDLIVKKGRKGAEWYVGSLDHNYISYSRNNIFNLFQRKNWKVVLRKEN